MELTQEKANELMKSRGYTSVSHFETKNEITGINFIKRLSDSVTIHAKVELKNGFVSLSFVELKYFCTLSINRFAIDHKDFDKYEQIMLIYSAACNETNPFDILDQWKEARGEGEPQPAKTKGKDLKQRKRDFWDEIVAIAKKRGYKEIPCRDFYKYWTQKNSEGRKFLFEITKAKKGVFDVGGRLATWMKNDRDWKVDKKDRVEKKADQQNKELRKQTKTIDPKELF